MEVSFEPDTLGAMSKFGVNLYCELVKSQKNGLTNAFMCPASIFTALIMIERGSVGFTSPELARLLQLSYLEISLFTRIANALEAMFKSSPGAVLSLANRVFVQKNLVLMSSYLDYINKHSSIHGIQSVDFADDPEAVRNLMNKWVKEKTNDKINELFPKNSVSSDTALVISNAVYFKGFWEHVFNESATRDGEFTVLDGSKKNLKFMFRNAEFKRGDLPDAEVIKLPFRDPCWEMLIIMPHEHDGLPKLLETLQIRGKFMEILKQDMEPEKLDLYLPRFKLSEGDGVDLKSLLISMGVKTLFNPAECDLTRIVESPQIYVSDIKHKAILEVNEEGATAAAGTGALIMAMCMPPSLHINQPFVVAIVYKNTTPVFLGHVIEPELF